MIPFKMLFVSLQMLGKFLCCSLVLFVVAAQKSKIPCGLPPFVSKLPAKQAQQLNETWANYTNGSDCSAEQKRTFEIIGSLTEAERDAVFETKEEPSSGLVSIDTEPRTRCREYSGNHFSVLVDDQFDTTPTFIKSLSEEKHKGFDDIWMNTEISDTEKHKKLRDYAKENFNDEQKAGFEEWMTGIVNAKKAVEERISKLSPSAKEMLDKIIKVRQEERRLLGSLSPELSKELYGLI
ncbi:hypothetical protein ANCCAN_01056 [Ancylostoma caninum]|uniref:SXP/RAL-2 family protein Ani s 5-like cation-binding domain-containing protein n=1 Tax=Ancylostoma caninum TaxID=29170 RepID=A0A368HBC9_ANCCA|nr:hypothetical protein ANCCAN_01056 [Ancylostoma caninum]